MENFDAELFIFVENIEPVDLATVCERRMLKFVPSKTYLVFYTISTVEKIIN